VTGNVPALRQLRSLSGEARIGLTWTDGETPPLALLEELRAEYWNPWFGMLTEAGAAAVHEAGRLVSCWTVDEAADMERVDAWGADAVVSNQVRALVQYVAASGS
jgi:glycerophosphoryl diester phosphodiesterase